jgi:hypothetical protein
LCKPTAAAANEGWGWEDVVGWAWAIEELAEGPVWQSSTRGVRLPAAVMAKSQSHEVSELPVLPRREFYAKRKINNVLWANEDHVDETLLEPAEKGLLADHDDLEMRIPKGWQLPEGGIFLERLV